MLSALRGAVSVGRDRDIAAEGRGADSRRAITDGERETFGIGRTDSLLARFKRNRKLAVDAAVPGLHGQLRARVALHVKPNVAGMSRKIVTASRIDEAIERDITARRFRPHELGRDTTKLDVAAKLAAGSPL